MPESATTVTPLVEDGSVEVTPITLENITATVIRNQDTKQLRTHLHAP